MADVPIDCDFPVWGLLPKKETGIVSFLNKYPNYDGKDTVIAIFDSGVDPAASGLTITSTGKTKVIERFDCTGCGDVDTSAVIRKVVDGCITGITGRKLKIQESWKNPTGEWRVGVLYPFSLYPTKVKERIQEHRKEHLWDVGHKTVFAEANKKLQEFESEVVSKNSTLSAEDKLIKEELEAKIEVLQSADKKYNDLGPTYDCVLFHDGNVWRACIDTSEIGDLSSGPLLGEYSRTHEHTHLTPLDEMTVTINVHDEGNTLEVVGMCSTHGTHVAAIASGYFPEEPDRNGVAPGAQIVSLTIGDSRLGSMETGTALVRACIKVMELCKTTQIDVINMSYGEHAHWSNAGRIGDIISSVVNRYGVSWVVSGGNHGPALATVGAPPDIAHPVLIGVGAYVSPEMMSAAYSMRARVPHGAFSWSSRGPCPDGAAGLAICAPGGAVASVARFTLRNSQLMNGTSMAAPHVAGAVAVLMSGLKAKGLPYSPYSVKRALENSATYLNHVEPWAQGCGLLNVEKAFEILSQYHEQPERDVTFNISCGANTKGIFLRPRPDEPPRDVAITIEPHFLHRDSETKEAVIRRQIQFGVRLALSTCAEWISAPTHLDLMNAPRLLSVRVNTAHLQPGPHFASINAYDVSCIEKGPVFRIPVTVLQPQPLPPSAAAPQLTHSNVVFKPATIRRHLVIPPLEATWGVLKMSLAGNNGEVSGRFLVHCMQLAPQRSCRTHETHKMLAITSEAPTLLPFQLIGGVTLEVVIAKYWANLGDLCMDYTLEFHGLKPDFGPQLTLSAHALGNVALAALRAQDVQPAAQLKHSEPLYRPTDSKISPLTSRDVIPPSRQIYQMINTYTFHIAKATEVAPIVSLLCDMLYESEFESQMWMLYNSSKQLMAVGDAYPSKYSVKLEKGEYTVRLSVRHENKSLLERLQDVPLVVQQRLAQPITLDAYCSQSNALTGGKKFTTASLSSGNLMPLYFTPVPADKISRSNLTVGQTLTGTVTFAKDELGRRVDVYQVQYVLCEAPRRRDNRDKEKDKTKTHEDYLDAVKELSTTWLPKLEGDKLDQVYEELVEKFPGYLGAHVAYLQAIDPPTDCNKLPSLGVPEVTTAWCEQLVNVADKVVRGVDQEQLLAYLGIRNDSRPEAAKIKQEHEKQRGYLIEALCRKGTALCRLHALASSAAARDKIADTLKDNMSELLKFTDLTDTKVIHYGVWHCFTLKHWGRAIKLLNKMLEEKPSREVEERLVAAHTQLGWSHLAEYTQRAIPTKSSENYQEYKKRRNPSSTWNYFLTATDRSSAKCKICSRIVRTNGASTSGLHAHLKTRHGIKVDSVQKRNNYSENETTKASHDAPLLIVMAQDNNGSYDDNAGKSPKNINLERSSSSFEEYSRYHSSSSYLWCHFLRSADAQTAKCKICSKILKTSGASTSGLHTHLKSKHKINILKRPDKRNQIARFNVKKEKVAEIPVSIVKQEAQTSYDESELETPVYNDDDLAQAVVDESSYNLENCEQNVNTHMKIISRMAALDELPLSSFCDSIDLCNLLSQSGYELPSSNIETISLILEQSDLVKIEIANELKQFKSLGMKFCLSFEEYITLNNRTYVSINIYNVDSKFGYPKNLGLLKVKSGMDSDDIIKMISDRLLAFDINLNDDIISFTNSLSQMRLGISLGIDNQFCLAQAVQYGVLEVLYKEEDSQIYQNTEDSYDSDTEYNTKECRNAFFVKYAEILTEPQLIYKEIIEKVRKLVQYYKNSAARNEILQNNVRKKHDKEIHLILDCKKSWSTLCEMICRFLKLKDCIHESLTYLEMDLFINDEELQILNEIHESLVVIRATITVLCKPSANLLTADTALRFMIRKLDAQNNAISRHFSTVLRKHIKRSRTITSSILQYLHHRHIYNEYAEDDAFTKPTSEEMVNKILTLLTRIKPSIEDKLNTFDYKSKTTARRVLDPLESEDDEETSIERQLENEINNTCHSEIPKPKEVPQELDLKKIILGEISIYESTGGTRGLYLTMAYDLLLSVMPATSEAEHFFFSRKDAHKRLSSHPEALLNSLFLLREFFKEQRRLEES
ncbi:unnamed protein product [Pieris macdunnoughi]|uniref:Tripeptidyl-peptidase 2 n=1 Tax=Pieris macdunnoughi TaxID=345717 RepID=A0A821SW83_9NEOP|nr:unnamed protein product [Pieris macdunnoughi]